MSRMNAAAALVALTACQPPLNLGPSRFERSTSNPLLSGWREGPDGRREWTIADPSALFDEEEQLYKLWYTTLPVPGCDERISDAEVLIKYAESRDGIAWTVQAEPALRGRRATTDWDWSLVETPSVVKLRNPAPGRRYAMLYAGGNKPVSRFVDVVPAWQIGLAFSEDGRTFTRLPLAESPYAGNAAPFEGAEGLVLMARDVFPSVAGTQHGVVADPELIEKDGVFHLFMGGVPTNLKGDKPLALIGISHATSTDLIHWTPSKRNPLITWPEGTAGQPTGYYDAADQKFHLWFSGETDAQKKQVPSALFPTLGSWSVTSTDGETFEPLAQSRDFNWDATVPGEDLGLLAGPEVLLKGDEVRLFYGSFSSLNPPAGSCAAVNGRGFVPGVQNLNVATMKR